MAGYRPEAGRPSGGRARSPQPGAAGAQSRDSGYRGRGNGYRGGESSVREADAGFGGDDPGYEPDWRSDPGPGRRGSGWDSGRAGRNGRDARRRGPGEPDTGQWAPADEDTRRWGPADRDGDRWGRGGPDTGQWGRGGPDTGQWGGAEQGWSDRDGDRWGRGGPDTGQWGLGEPDTGQWGRAEQGWSDRDGDRWGSDTGGWESAAWDYSARDREAREARQRSRRASGGPRRAEGDWDGAPDPTGGADGNERLTGMTGAVLLALFAVEGLTILRIHQLLTLHFFFGMMLIGPVLLKVGSTLYRFARYYTGAQEYKRKGPPSPLLRLLGPFVVLLSVTVIGSGVMLAVVGPGDQIWMLAHKASFVLWFGAMTIHVLAYVWRLPQLISGDLAGRAGRRASEVLGGRPARWLLLSASLLTGLVLAMMTVHQVDLWSGFVGG